MMVMGLFWIVLLGILVVAVVALVRPSQRAGGGGAPQGDTPGEILRRRYARGEIDAAEFEERMRRLS